MLLEALAGSTIARKKARQAADRESLRVRLLRIVGNELFIPTPFFTFKVAIAHFGQVQSASQVFEGQLYRSVWRDYVYIHRFLHMQNRRSDRIKSDLSDMSLGRDLPSW